MTIPGRYAPWLGLLLGVDGFCAILLWLSDVRAFRTLIGLILLVSVLLFALLALVLHTRENVRRERFRELLTDPNPENETRLLSLLSREEGDSIRLLAEVLREGQRERSAMADDLLDYREYVESWAHEAKTPLSLLTMLLDNRKEELSPALLARLEYIRSGLQEDVAQMLYYARLKSATKDYRFENLPLGECLGEVLEDYAPLLEEKQFVIVNRLGQETVYTDRRGLVFLLGQIISNAIKYSAEEPMLTISLRPGQREDALTIADNGMGVKSWELPYIFQKGFTGDSTDSRKKATGMGLYLARRMADDLKLRLEAESQWGEGFQMTIYFPK